MKKILVFAAIFALVASSLFAAAAPAAKAKPAVTAAPAADLPGITTFTKQYSEANYPGVLTSGSLNGSQTFVQDLPLLCNTALFEYVYGITGGLLAMKTDIIT